MHGSSSISRKLILFALVCLCSLGSLSFGDPGDANLTHTKWQVMQRSDKQVPVFTLGTRGDLVSQELAPGELVPLSPPDMGVGLGLATVRGASEIGLFLHAGRRLHMKNPDGMIHSYESLAKLGWAVGISRSQAKSYSARISYSGNGEMTLSLEDLLRRAVDEAPGADSWIVAGQVDYGEVRGQWLRRLAAAEVSEEGKSVRRSLALESKTGPGLLVALVVKASGSSKASEVLRGKFFNAGEDSSDLLIRAHYALFEQPAPAMDSSRTFLAIWQVANKNDVPKILKVGEALEGTSIQRANLLVWSVGSVERYDLYKEPDFVDVTMLDRAILTDQRFATTNNPFGIALYPKPRFVLREAVAKAILKVNKRLLAEGYRLMLNDAYRPLSVTQRLWGLYQNLEVSNDAERRYLAVPNVGSRHNRGAAVDCTMADLGGNPVEMPSDYLAFDSSANLDSASMTPTARKNLAILSKAMQAEGFTTIRDEWWHFDAPGWMNYRVADVPFWPEAGQEDTITRRTKILMAEMDGSEIPDELPDLPAQPEVASNTPQVDPFELPALPSEQASPQSVQNTPQPGRAASPKISREKVSPAPEDEKRGGAQVLDYFRDKMDRPFGLPLLFGSLGGMAVLAGATLVMMVRSGRRRR